MKVPLLSMNTFPVHKMCNMAIPIRLPLKACTLFLPYPLPEQVKNATAAMHHSADSQNFNNNETRTTR